MTLQNLTLALGGAASGKSAFAERLVEAASSSRLYIATAEIRDAEMGAKVARHRARRGAGWRTLEAPRDLAAALAAADPGEAVLIDCATLWLTNLMLADADLGTEEDRLLAALAACPAPVAVVSNELGLGLVPETPLGRRFREAQGALNQRLAAQAGRVVFVAAGLPLVLKGALP
jgi:adenosylcobinamide kinase/adenosylcobinamide-phosphate guanylyltransferase